MSTILFTASFFAAAGVQMLAVQPPPPLLLLLLLSYIVNRPARFYRHVMLLCFSIQADISFFDTYYFFAVWMEFRRFVRRKHRQNDVGMNLALFRVRWTSLCPFFSPANLYIFAFFLFVRVSDYFFWHSG